MNTPQTLVIFALVAALGLVGIISVNIILTTQEAEASCEKGNAGSHAFNQSKENVSIEVLCHHLRMNRMLK
jgi:multidrug efflux pump subunit AcrB